MAGRFKFTKLAKYPHMKPEDISTWEMFMLQYPNQYDSVDYDFPLGKLPDHADAAAELGISGAEKVYQYKSDVVGYNKDSIDILEIKGKATPATIGQVIGYKLLYLTERGSLLPVKAKIICREATPHLESLCQQQNVELILV